MSIQSFELKFKFLDYFAKSKQINLTPQQKSIEHFLINFSLIALSTIFVLTIAYALLDCWQAFWVNFVGTIFFIFGLFVYKKSNFYVLPIFILFFTSCCILFTQHVILEHDAFHNMLFYPVLATFCFATINDSKIRIYFLALLIVSAILTYYLGKYHFPAVKILSQTQKDLSVIGFIILSIFLNFKIIEKLYQSKMKAHIDLLKIHEKNRQLLAVLTHDIANPLAVMTASVEILSKHKNEPEKINQFIERYKKSEKYIFEIIDNSRKMLALEDGKIHPNISKVYLNEIIDDLLDIFQNKLEAKNLSVNYEPSVPDICFKADPVFFKTSIFSNILSNAIKFSHPNSVIHIKALKSDRYVEFIIRDSGIGMPKDLLDKIFDMHQLTSRVGTFGESGTGYGLPITKAYVDAMQGKISCESKEGEGTTFRIMLPTCE